MNTNPNTQLSDEVVNIVHTDTNRLKEAYFLTGLFMTK